MMKKLLDVEVQRLITQKSLHHYMFEFTKYLTVMLLQGKACKDRNFGKIQNKAKQKTKTINQQFSVPTYLL